MLGTLPPGLDQGFARSTLIATPCAKPLILHPPLQLGARLKLEMGEYADARRLANAAIQRHLLNPIITVQAGLLQARAMSEEGNRASATAACVAAADEAKRVGMKFMEAKALQSVRDSEEHAARRRQVVSELQSDEREVVTLLGV